jgi:GABA permease
MTELLTPTLSSKPAAEREAQAETPRSTTSRRRLLVVVDQPCTAPELCASVRGYVGADRVDALVIAPAHGSPDTQWYVDEDAARADATHRLRACVACLADDGIRADGQLSDPDPVQAIADALHEFPAEEILIVTAPQRPSNWLHQNVIDRARRRFEQPIAHVVMPTPPSRRRA